MIINQRKVKQILLKRKSKEQEYLKVGTHILENQNIMVNKIIKVKGLNIYAMLIDNLNYLICLDIKSFDSAFLQMIKENKKNKRR